MIVIQYSRPAARRIISSPSVRTDKPTSLGGMGGLLKELGGIGTLSVNVVGAASSVGSSRSFSAFRPWRRTGFSVQPAGRDASLASGRGHRGGPRSRIRVQPEPHHFVSAL